MNAAYAVILAITTCFIGYIAGVLHTNQIHKEAEHGARKEDNLSRDILILIQDKIDAYKCGKLNPFTALRDISNILFKKGA